MMTAKQILFEKDHYWITEATDKKRRKSYAIMRTGGSMSRRVATVSYDMPLDFAKAYLKYLYYSEKNMPDEVSEAIQACDAFSLAM